MMNDSKEDFIELFIKRVDYGILSDYWFNHARVNDLLRVEGPKGTFFFKSLERPIILLATGTGLAPIVSILNMLNSLHESSYKKKVYFFWGNRKVEDFCFDINFENLDISYFKVLSSEKISGFFNGYVQDVALDIIKEINNFDVYACGSEKMIISAKKKFLQFGLSHENFYSDIFLDSGQDSGVLF